MCAQGNTLKDWSIPVYSSASNDLTPGGNVHQAKRPGAISCGAVRKSHCDACSGEIISAWVDVSAQEGGAAALDESEEASKGEEELSCHLDVGACRSFRHALLERSQAF
jgi:hypothetical protein